MKFSTAFLNELQHEAANTRKLLEAVPFNKADFKPHEKSMTLKKLAIHTAEITGWWKECLTMDELDFSKGDHTPKDFNSSEELLAHFDMLVANAVKIITDTPDEEYQKPWTMRNGETIYFTMSKAAVVRMWCMNHLYHHRGQLTVYLRLLDIPVPSSFGPTADFPAM